MTFIILTIGAYPYLWTVKISKMKNIFELAIAVFIGLVLLISLPFLMIKDATAVID